MKHKTITIIAQSAAIAALYAVATLALAPFSFGPIQFRVSEALTIMPLFTPAAIPGLTIGCAIANTAGVALGLTTTFDIVFGSFATLLAAVFTYLLRNIKLKNIPFLALFPPVIFNAIIIGMMITLFIKAPTFLIFLYYAATIAIGQIVACYGLGLPLYLAIKKTGFDKWLNRYG